MSTSSAVSVSTYKPPEDVEGKIAEETSAPTPRTIFPIPSFSPPYIPIVGSDVEAKTQAVTKRTISEYSHVTRNGTRGMYMLPFPMPRIKRAGLSWFIPCNFPEMFVDELRKNGFFANGHPFRYEDRTPNDDFHLLDIDRYEDHDFSVCAFFTPGQQLYGDFTWDNYYAVPGYNRELFQRRPRKFGTFANPATFGCCGRAYFMLDDYPGFKIEYEVVKMDPCRGCFNSPYRLLTDRLDAAVTTYDITLLDEIESRCLRIVRKLGTPVNFFTGMLEMCRVAKNLIHVRDIPGFQWTYGDECIYQPFQLGYVSSDAAGDFLRLMLTHVGFINSKPSRSWDVFAYSEFEIDRKPHTANGNVTYEMMKRYVTTIDLTPDNLKPLIIRVFGTLESYLTQLHQNILELWHKLDKLVHSGSCLYNNIPESYEFVYIALLLKNNRSIDRDSSQIILDYLGVNRNTFAYDDTFYKWRLAIVYPKK